MALVNNIDFEVCVYLAYVCVAMLYLLSFY